jgi:hypothetical protein
MKRLAVGAPLIVLSVMLLMAARADAQKSPQRMPYDRYDRSRPDRDRISPPPPVAPRLPGSPQPQSPPPGLPSSEFRLPPSSPFDAGPYTYAPRYAPRYGARSRPLRPYGYSSNGLPYSVDDLNAGAANVDSPFAVAEPLGRLFVDTEPSTALIFVDGIPAGRVADFRGVGIQLPEGVRRVELRAPGYESAGFDVNILTQQPAVYRGDLAPLRPVAGPVMPAARRGSDTFYVIPGCYAGNRPPLQQTLPKGCDVARSKKIS